MAEMDGSVVEEKLAFKIYALLQSQNGVFLLSQMEKTAFRKIGVFSENIHLGEDVLKMP